MVQTDLLEWANSIRLTMVNDPGRKLFQEQVQTHGFSFLDDYLDNILSGAKQDPLIELVKTPGRKKAVSRKPHIASKLMQVATVSPEDDDVADKNRHPYKSFTQALLSGKTQPSAPKQDPERASPEPVTRLSRSEKTHASNEPTTSTHTAPLELSVIKEDDEGIERSRISIQTPSNNVGGQIATTPIQTHNRMSSPHSHSQDHNPRSLELFVDPGSLISHEIRGAEGPAIIDVTVPLHESEPESSPPLLSTRKSVLSKLPTLPEPIPLWKSMRATKEPLVGNVVLGAATQGNTALGKRTSWLMKAREAKAMEGISKKSSAKNLSVATAVLAGVKRNSDEVTDPIDIEKEERKSKVLKQQKDETAPTKSASTPHPEFDTKPAEETSPRPEQDGVPNLPKKKVQGLESRNDKLGNKVFQDAAVALAEARAQAEARIAERNHQKEASTVSSTSDAAVNVSVNQVPAEKALLIENRRFSISDLFPSDSKMKDKSKAPHKSPVFAVPQSNSNTSIPAFVNDESISTTPPHSPPSRGAVMKIAPVFNKPPPVFIPPIYNPRPLPIPPTSKEATVTLAPPSGAFTKPSTKPLGISPVFGSPLGNKTKAVPLSTHSTMQTEPDDLFDNRRNTEAWIPNTQETEYSSVFGTQSSDLEQLNVLDDDDSWPIDEKLSHGGHWPFGGQSKEDSLTWSTLPSQSQRVDTGPNAQGSKDREAHEAHPGPGGLDEDMDIEHEDFNTNNEAIDIDHELEEIILSGAKSVQSGDNQGQTSLVSSGSSQSQTGFFGQASKFLSNALGTSKKGKPEVKKVMQMAALAAKKQQEEDDKKANRLKEMENRRQLAMQRKAEEEKVRQQEQERKAKDEVGRRKRERDEPAEKKPLKPIAAGLSKRDEEITKKRKVDLDKPEKRLEPKKQIPLTKTGFKPTSKQTSALSSSAAFNTSQSSQSIIPTATIKPSEKPSKVPTAISAKGKTKQKLVAQVDEEHTQPSQIIQTQMAARAKAAMQTEVRVPSESIELPEVNSEYSDSEDEDRPRTFNPPEWAQSPELRQALEAQSTINPDDIFGAIRPLRMEELFKARTSRFRARTSSANWSGADRLTVEEEREYARRMGFK